MGEIWKDIKGYEGLYQISDRGNVKSFKYGKERKLKPCKFGNGYLIINLSINGYYNSFNIHRLVCESFLPNPENKEQVNHKNGIKSDNRLDNLEWVTRSENAKHSFDILGRKGSKSALGKFGSNHNRSIPICRYSKLGEYIDEFEGFMDAYRKTGINISSIHRCCKGEYSHAGGYIWEYKERERFFNY